jgi:hypothetical protein
MKRLFALLALAGAACAPGVYTRAEVVYAEPPQYEYVVPVDRVVFVTRDVLVTRGYVVFRVEADGYNRVIWARRGEDEVVRVFVNPTGQRVLVRGIREVRERGDDEERGDRENRGRHRGWRRQDRADEVIRDVDARLRREGH